ncbi:D-2-hydroxyacid dehydrogenase family protein [Mesorhizobium sp. CAU 1741]|uniref:D-2-hydroxyacid dehydrogenase family protein n=1 Tax=Mesorhizobium sp. CAU 1741 TaxID=3140366 RepID=UPI00325BC564
MPDYRTPPENRPVRIAILDDYLNCALTVADWSGLQGKAEITVFDKPFADAKAAVAALQPFDVISTMRERTPIPRALIEALPELRLITMTGARNPTLDIAAARERGIPVVTTGGGGNGAYATVELAWGLILALARRLPEHVQAMHDGAWQRHLGIALNGRTLGLIGLGRLGARMAPVGRAMGMDVIAWSPNLTDERAEVAGARRVDKQVLMETADVISIHMVLSDSTKGLVGAGEFSRMKPGAFLVNTSRGPLVDEAALLAALHEGRIGGAGIDVYDHEPLASDHPLRKAPRTVLTPHLGYTVEETIGRFYVDTVENIQAWLDGRTPRLVEPG